MKDIIIAGPPRAGKSTLARKINKELGHSIINLDGFAWVFRYEYPQVGFDDKNGDVINARIITRFLLRYIEVWYGPKYVAEGVYIDYDQFFATVNPDDFILIGLHYNSFSEDDLFMNMRKYDREGDWTFNRNEEKLRRDTERFVKDNTYHYEKLVKHGFTVYDVSAEREAVFSQIVDAISADYT